MGFLDELKDGGTREKSALLAGKYTDLQLVSYIAKTSGPSKSDAELYRHAFLVASDGTDGTAFFDIRVKSLWFHPPVVALAFNAVEAAIADGTATQEEIDSCAKLFRDITRARVEASNTPTEKLEDVAEYTDEDGVVHAATKGAYTTAYENLLTQIRIALGTIFRLQAWAGQKRSLDVDIPSLVGTKFAGEVKEGRDGTSELKSVYTAKKAVTTPAKKTPVAVTA